MAPTRRPRGANKETTKVELRSGDLVLAKVLGFPAWPAQVRRPEDLGRAPDPRKYFVQFFGTQETAFVAAADTHPLTHESKSKLLTECHGKTITHFARAVKEICDAFEEFQSRKSDVLGNEGDQKVTDVKVKEEICSEDDKRNESVSSGGFHAKIISSKLKVSKSTESKNLGVGSKRKFKVSTEEIEDHDSFRDIKDTKLRKIASGRGARGASLDVEKSEVFQGKGTKSLPSGRKNIQGKGTKSLPSGRKNICTSTGSLKDAVAKPKWHADSDRSGLEKSRKPGPEKSVSSADGNLVSDKKTMNVEMVNDVRNVVIVNNAPHATDKTLNKIADAGNPEPASANELTNGDEEGVLPLTKRCRQEPGLLSDASDGQKGLPHRSHKTDALKKRRAIRLDDEDDDKPKTPVHGRPSSKVSTHRTGNHESSHFSGKGISKASGESREQILSSKSFSTSSSHAPLLQAASLCKMSLSSKSLWESESRILLSTDKESSQVNATGNKLVERLGNNVHRVSPQRSSEVVAKKAIKNFSKVSGIVSQTKALQVSDKASTMGTPNISSQITKTEDTMNGISSSLDGNLSGPKSIKHLIAAAKNAQMHYISHGNAGSFSTPSANIQGTSLNPPSTGNPVLGTQTSVQLDLHVSQNKATSVSPARHNQLSSQNPLNNGGHKDMLSSGCEAGGVTLSGGTDAAISRDAFEGMIETLSRTKESIGRATRLAINCAKYGIASEVVDLLIRRLENEPNNRRRVDLFFLLDSITQCSHSQKGIAGAPYIPAVHAVLPRLFSAMVPPGVGSRENRRQCLKVLRLWLERKIFPESVLRQFMDDIEATGADIKSVLSSRRPSRSDRGVDDPLREIGAIQFDEYGSNASFQLDSIFGVHRFNEDEEDGGDPVGSLTQAADASPVSSCIQAAGASPLDRALPEPGSGRASPMDECHCILEDVNGELEMEDAPRNPKDENKLIVGACRTDVLDCYTNSKSENDFDEASSRKGSPPLPMESPPAVPPLPSSPPPLSSPSPTRPPPPPPPTSALAPPLHSQMHPSFFSPPSSMQPPVLPLRPQSMFSFQGNQPAHTAHNMLQSPSFGPAGIAVQQEAAAHNSSRSLEHRHKHNDVFGSQTTEFKQQLHPAGQAAFAKTPSHPARPPHTSQNLNPYNKPIHQISPHPYPSPFSSPSLPNARTPFIAQKRWRASSAGYRRDCRNRTLMNGGRTHTGSFHPPANGPPSNNMGFQYPSPNPPRIAGPPSGHNRGHFFPSRSDMSAVNRWRPG